MLMFCNPKTKSICANSRRVKSLLSCWRACVSKLTLAWLWLLLLEHIATATTIFPKMACGQCVSMTRLARSIMAKRLLTLLALDWRYPPPKRAIIRPVIYPLRWLVAHPPPASEASRWADICPRKEQNGQMCNVRQRV